MARSCYYLSSLQPSRLLSAQKLQCYSVKVFPSRVKNWSLTVAACFLLLQILKEIDCSFIQIALAVVTYHFCLAVQQVKLNR